jgi:protein-S-isoprenylcysteine O-methyltransferase Ste14
MEEASKGFAVRGGWWVVGQFLLMAGVVVGGYWPVAGWRGGLGLTLGCGMMVVGGVLGWLSFRTLGRGTTPYPRPLPGRGLVTVGVYGVVRHPMYCSVIVVSTGWGVAREGWMALVMAGVLMAFLDLKARREERWLRDRYEGYGAYAGRVRRLLPWIY